MPVAGQRLPGFLNLLWFTHQYVYVSVPEGINDQVNVIIAAVFNKYINTFIVRPNNLVIV